MLQKSTLKNFKVFLLRSFLSILVLGISFQVSFAQNPSKWNSKWNKGNQSVSNSTKSVVAPVLTKEMVRGNNNVQFPGKRTDATVAPVIINEMIKANNNLLYPATDVPEINQKIALRQSLYPGISSNPNPTTPTSNIINDVCVYNGALITGDQTFAARPFRGGVSSTCAATPACGTPLAGTFFYDTYTIQNLTCSPQCVTVAYLANASTPAGDIFVTAYLATFVPTAVCTNRIADGGLSSISTAGAPGATVTFSFNLAAKVDCPLLLIAAFKAL